MKKKDLLTLIDESIASAIKNELKDIKKLLVYLIKTQSNFDSKPKASVKEQVLLASKPKSINNNKRAVPSKLDQHVNYNTSQKKSKVKYTNNTILNEILNMTSPMADDISMSQPFLGEYTNDKHDQDVPLMDNKIFTSQDAVPTNIQMNNNSPLGGDHDFANRDYTQLMKQIDDKANKIRQQLSPS
jgi:hypothetical protein